jgi:two-component system, LuxR family, sensor kinase FixL
VQNESHDESGNGAPADVSVGAWLIATAGIIATWTFDLMTPLGVAGGAPYVLVVLVGLWTRSRRFVAGLALVCLILTLLGVAYSNPVLTESVYITNRAMTAFAVVICALLVSYQIKLRKQFQDSVRRQRDYLQVADVMLLGLDDQANITLLNRRGAELLGYSEQEVLGRNWIDLFVPEELRDSIRQMYADSMAGRQQLPTTYRNEVIVSNGDKRTFVWNNQILRDTQGRPAGVLCSGEDITDKQQTENERDRARTELHAAERLMAAVVENAVEGIITINSGGIMQTVNQAATKIFGYTREEMVGMNVSMLMPSPDREQHDGYLEAYVRTGVAGIIGKGREVTALRKNGERFPIYLSISDLGGEPRVFAGMVRDLTEEKRMQRQLQEQEALAVIGQMAAVVAHEVKNPLAGIAGVIQVLRGRQPGDTPEHQVMGDVLARIDSLVETLQDLLLFARPRELRLQEVQLNDLLDETTRLLVADPRAKGVELEMPPMECRLQLDVDYMREALLNIYLNAAQAMDGKGAIRTELYDEEGFCRICIADSGPGIPEDVRRRVFEPFFTTKGRGTGLGLALVKRVVERHGGEVKIECPEGGGTVVTLHIPHGAPPTP